jgi:hypothetical protein
VDAYPREAWKRLGQHLQQRRPQIDTRYRIRRIFAAENVLTDKTVQEIENAYRTTFSPVMLSTIEHAYQLKPGSIERFLSGEGDLEPAEPVVRVSQPPLRIVDPGVRIEQVDDGRLQVGFTIETDVTMDEMYERLGDLTPGERVMIANMEAMEFPPAEIGGAVEMLRKFDEHRTGVQGSRPRRRA